MPFHHLKTRVRESTVVGTTVAIASATVVEALGASPFDALLIDAEHSPLSVEGLENLLRAADLAPKAAIVRVPEVGSYIARVLDLGAAVGRARERGAAPSERGVASESAIALGPTGAFCSEASQ